MELKNKTQNHTPKESGELYLDNKDINTKADEIINGAHMSPSKIDRLLEPKDLLMDYLATYLNKVQLKNPVLEKLLKRYDDERAIEELTEAARLRLIELLLKKETEDNTPLINLFAKALEVKKDKKEEEIEKGNKKSKDDSFTQEEMSKAKKFLKRIDDIEKATKGEF